MMSGRHKLPWTSAPLGRWTESLTPRGALGRDRERTLGHLDFGQGAQGMHSDGAR